MDAADILSKVVFLNPVGVCLEGGLTDMKHVFIIQMSF
jgi:hypothetical protein